MVRIWCYSKTYLLNIWCIGNKLFTLFLRGYSSAGRASALQAEGHRFDPGTLHQKSNLEWHTFSIFFDIVYKCVKIHETFLGFFQVREKQDIQLSTENSLSKSKNLLTKFYSILE